VILPSRLHVLLQRPIVRSARMKFLTRDQRNAAVLSSHGNDAVRLLPKTRFEPAHRKWFVDAANTFDDDALRRGHFCSLDKGPAMIQTQSTPSTFGTIQLEVAESLIPLFHFPHFNLVPALRTTTHLPARFLRRSI
jgi:hypothetical protein